MVVDEDSQLKMAKAISHAVQRASLTLAEYAKGNYGGPSLIQHGQVAKLVKPLGKAATFKELIDGWANERKPAQKTLYEWSRVFRQFAAYLNHDDASSVSSEDVRPVQSR